MRICLTDKIFILTLSLVIILNLIKKKNINNYNTFYTDTDSIYTDEYLPEEFIGNKLLQFKLEHKFKEAIFLCPKVYGVVYSLMQRY